MFAARSAALATLRRSFSTAAKGKTVAVLGAAGGIGQPLSLLLKNMDSVGQLNVFDVVNTPGVAADLSHINSPALVRGFVSMTHVDEALEGVDIAIIPAGVPRKPGMTRDDLFNTNANIVKDLAGAIAKVCPKAMILAIINPLNSAVPIIAEVLKKAGVYDPKRVFGVTTLDSVRASTFVAKFHDWSPHDTHVRVIGGHAGTTIIPLLSQVPNASFSDDDIAALTKRIQFGGDEVVKAKDGRGSATLSMAYAGAHFAQRLMDGMNGVPDVVECTYCANNLTEAPYFAAPVTLGPNGIEKVHGFGALSQVEQANLDTMLPELIKQINKGIAYGKK